MIGHVADALKAGLSLRRLTKHFRGMIDLLSYTTMDLHAAWPVAGCRSSGRSSSRLLGVCVSTSSSNVMFFQAVPPTSDWAQRHDHPQHPLLVRHACRFHPRRRYGLAAPPVPAAEAEASARCTLARRRHARQAATHHGRQPHRASHCFRLTGAAQAWARPEAVVVARAAARKGGASAARARAARRQRPAPGRMTEAPR